MKTVQSGWLDGHPIRKARKPGYCEYWHGASGGHCANMIAAGDYCVYGEPNGKAGGYAQARYCMECVKQAYEEQS